MSSTQTFYSWEKWNERDKRAGRCKGKDKVKELTFISFMSITKIKSIDCSVQLSAAVIFDSWSGF